MLINQEFKAVLHAPRESANEIILVAFMNPYAPNLMY